MIIKKWPSLGFDYISKYDYLVRPYDCIGGSPPMNEIGVIGSPVNCGYLVLTTT
ncbi:hypothetical protein [Xenorhabdus littoralis]|uniref:hypothetical protein n=1 Tax=Xenorhabdus littoralis TaxID=2582835 RepID=UPI0029E818E7|nr:hypothetical protein [Xenorhabdus sp. Reich]